MTRILCIFLGLALAGCAVPRPDTLVLEEPVIMAEEALSPEDCDIGDDGIGGTGCPER